MDEDGAHLFVKCKAVKVLWRSLDMEHVRARLEAAHSVHETLDMLWALHEQERVVILTMWWQWW